MLPATSAYPAALPTGMCTDDAARCPAWNILALPGAIAADPSTDAEDPRASGTATHGVGPADEYAQGDRIVGTPTTPAPGPLTDRENHRAGTTTNRDCAYASVTGVPGEDCTER